MSFSGFGRTRPEVVSEECTEDASDDDGVPGLLSSESSESSSESDNETPQDPHDFTHFGRSRPSSAAPRSSSHTGEYHVLSRLVMSCLVMSCLLLAQRKTCSLEWSPTLASAERAQRKLTLHFMICVNNYTKHHILDIHL